ncbi:MAG: NADH-quinone oxidoreductase subunit NuoK [Dehalococcoidia bacterium]
MMMLHFQLLSAALFCLGVYGVLARRSIIMVLMAVELMLNAVNINLIAYAAYRDIPTVTGHVIALFVITIAAAEVALALAIVVRLFRSRGSANVDQIDLMRG